MVHEQVVRKIADPELSILVVWEPILRLDSERTARRATGFVPDPRARHFWAPTTAAGEAFQRPIGLSGEPAWDVYLIYPKGARWGAAPPRPRDYMHQLAGRLPASKRLDGGKLAAKIEALLER